MHLAVNLRKEWKGGAGCAFKTNMHQRRYKRATYMTKVNNRRQKPPEVVRQLNFQCDRARAEMFAHLRDTYGRCSLVAQDVSTCPEIMPQTVLRQGMLYVIE